MESTQEHKNDVLASNLLFGSLALTVAIALIRHRVLPAGNQASDGLFAGGLAVVSLLYSGLFYAIRRGHYWAKVLLLMLFIVALVSSLITYKTTFSPRHMDSLNILSNIVHYVVRIWALVLLFRRPKLQPI